MDADELLARLERLNVADVVNTALLKNTDKAEDALRKQHKKGDSATGKIGKYHSMKYARYKSELNPEAGLGNVDLYLTGSFAEKIKASVTSDELLFTSTDNKTEKLVQKYSDSILDLNGQNNSIFADEIRVDFEQVITKITGIPFTP